MEIRKSLWGSIAALTLLITWGIGNVQAGSADGDPISESIFIHYPEPSTILDHFLSYKVKRTKGTPKFEKQEVNLTDQFESGVLFEVKKPKELYNPADKNGEGIIDPDTHLVGYEIKRAMTDTPQPKHVERANIEVVNQFGTIFVDTKKPDRLLVPSLKDLDIPIPEIDVPDEFPVDHFKCYKVKVSEGSEFPEGIQVDVMDEFNQPKLFDVKKPKRLCNPVDKNGEGSINPFAHLMCYKVKPAEDEPKHIKVEGIHTNNQFGPLQVDSKEEAELCVPSAVDLPQVVDNTDTAFSTIGTWSFSTFKPGFIETNYQFEPPGNGSETATWTFVINQAGQYEVAANWTSHPNRAPDAPYTILNNGNVLETVPVDQRVNGGHFVSLGTFALEVGTLEVELTNAASGFVIADAVQVSQ